MSKKVLIVSNPQDEHTARVSALIEASGADAILFYPERLGCDSGLALRPELNDGSVCQTLLLGPTAINLSEVYSVWYRRPRRVSLNETAFAPEALAFVQEEWQAMLEATYALMDQAIWVSSPDCLREAAHKPLQLRLATQLGLNVPRTLITNAPDRVREFFELCKGKLIVKATGPGWVYDQNKSDYYFVLTNRINAQDLEATAEIAASPVTFQEEIPKDYEIRANVIGQQVFAIKIDSQQSEISSLDWRRYDVSQTPYSPYQLPPEIEKKCLKLAQLLGLEFGAIDLIRKPDGEYVFLEINGNGQFLWAEELSGVKVSQALASLLAGITPPLKSARL